MIISLFLAFSSLTSTQPIDQEMSPKEKKQTGLHKLTEKEKSELQAWIDNHYAKRETPLETPAEEKGMLSENLHNGSYIRLATGSLWKIHPKDIPITQGWITPVDIRIAQSGDPEHLFKLTNTLTGSSVKAQKVGEVPSSKES